MNIKLLITLLLFITLMVHAQSKLLPGIVIKLNNDTVYGNIEFKNGILIHSACRFQLKGDLLFTEYTPTDIKGFQFSQGKAYESKQLLNATPVFLERTGKNSPGIYSMHEMNGYHYYIENSRSELREIPYYIHRTHQQGRLVIIHSNQDYGLSNTLDNDAQSQGVGNRFRKAYNIEITGGKIFNQYTSFSDEVYHLGAMINLCNPYVEGHFYFRTGIQFLDVTNDRSENIFRTPFQVEYQSNGKVINVRLAAGANLYHPYYLTASLMGGLDIRISKNFSWTITYDVDYDKIEFNLNSPVINSLSTGFIIGI